MQINDLKEQDIRINEIFDILGYPNAIEVEALKDKSYCTKAEHIWNKISKESKQLLVAKFID